MTDLKASPCGEMSDQGQGPSQKLLRDLLERRGLIEDSSIRNEKARVAEKELRRNMYHNTQVMLKTIVISFGRWNAFPVRLPRNWNSL